MTLHQKKQKQIQLLGCCLLAALILNLGCSQNDPGDPTKDKKESTSGLKNLKLHRPESFQAAVKRLREMHSLVMSSPKELPAKNLKVVEIIHGEGAGAHSHFYLASKYKDGEKPKFDDHHEDMKETQTTHDIEVPFAKEYSDIVGWLPNLAAATDLGEDAWTSVQKHADQIEESIADSLKDSSLSVADTCKAYQQNGKTVEEAIEGLEALVTKLGAN